MQAAKQPNATKRGTRTFRVYVSQVNQTMVLVRARDAEEARAKGYAAWRRDFAHSSVCSVEEAAQ